MKYVCLLFCILLFSCVNIKTNLANPEGKQYVATTDTSGMATLIKIPAGKYQIKAVYVGYNKFTQDILLTDGLVYMFTISMKEKPFSNEVFIEY